MKWSTLAWNLVAGSSTGLALLTLTVTPTLRVGAQPAPAFDTVDDEILVLLRPGSEHPTAEEILETVNSDSQVPIPGGLGEGNPRRAEFVVRNRARGATRERLQAQPYSPRAVLERYLVLHYANAAAVPGLLNGLSRNPHVEFAEQNKPLRFHSAGGRPWAGGKPVSEAALTAKAVLADDPFLGPEGGDPEAHQWGTFLLNLPGAWDLVEASAMTALLDRGIQPGHPDLEPFDDSSIVPIYAGGNYRENMSFDYIGDDCDVDEKLDPTTNIASHGTHVSGILGATPNNQLGVSGACWHCPMAIAKIWNQAGQTGFNDAARAITDMVDSGAQLISMSFGLDGDCSNNSLGFNLTAMCNAIQFANDRDVLMIASVGNDRATTIEFPAVDPRVVAVGGVAPDGSLWDEWPNCPFGFQNSFECGSNVGPGLEFMAPAKSVLSTVYTNSNSNTTVGCGDSSGAVGTSSDGFGLCTGTSMASPYTAGTAAHPKTANPLLRQDQIRGLMQQTASLGGIPDPVAGYGIPNAGLAVAEAMGRVGGVVLRNRLTPFLVLHSTIHTAHLFTTSPQRAAAAVAGINNDPFSPVGSPVPGYSALPGVTATPRASVFLFTTPHTPSGQTFGLIPVYRMTKDPFRQGRCTEVDEPGAEWSFAYARDTYEIMTLRQDGYSIEGIEGYVADPNGPLPPGSVLLHRLFNADLDDWVVVPDSEVGSLPPGYGPRAGIPEILGAAMPNVDTDGDRVIDGFEVLIRTNPSDPDSDGDGVDDGDEILGYTGASPSGILGDPLCSGARCLFADNFETGDTSRWSSITQ